MRRETGREQKVKVLYGKGLASHTGPESCVSHREVRLEALTGEHTGQPLSRENRLNQGADALDDSGRQYDQTRYCECLDDPAWSETLACMHALCTGTGRPPVRPPNTMQGGPHREGEEP